MQNTRAENITAAVVGATLLLAFWFILPLWELEPTTRFISSLAFGVSVLLGGGGVIAARLAQTGGRHWRYRIASHIGWLLVAVGVSLEFGFVIGPALLRTSHDLWLLLAAIPVTLQVLSQVMVLWAKSGT